MDYVAWIVWSVTALLMLTGLAGTVLPLLPGSLLILAGALVHKIFLPESISWLAFGWIAAFAALSLIADIGCTLLGTRLFGGTKWGLAGAGGGAVAGMFISLPALVLGSIFGAIAAEKFGARRSTRDALWSGAGAAVGFILSTVARAACAVAMIAVFLVATLR